MCIKTQLSTLYLERVEMGSLIMYTQRKYVSHPKGYLCKCNI